MFTLSKKILQNWLIIFLVVVYLVTCLAVSYNAIVPKQYDRIVPNIYFNYPTPQPNYGRQA